jgi:hypothetical protein
MASAPAFDPLLRKHRDAKLRHKRLLALEWPASVVAIDMLLSLLLRGVAHAASARPEATCLKACLLEVR